MSNIKKNSLKHVFLAESDTPKSVKTVVNPNMDKVTNTSKTDKNVADLANKKKVKDVNKELDDYKSILEGPFDDAFEKYLNPDKDFEKNAEKEKSKKNLTKLDAPFSNNLKECGLDMDSTEHEAMETPEEEAMEHMDNGVVITIGHNADEEMEKTGQDAFNIGRKVGAPGGPNFKDGIDDSEHSLEEAGFGKTISNFGKNVVGAVGDAAHWAVTPKKQLDKEKRIAAKNSAIKKQNLAQQNADAAELRNAESKSKATRDQQYKQTQDSYQAHLSSLANQDIQNAKNNQAQNVRTQRGPQGQTGTGPGGIWTKKDDNELARSEQERAKRNKIPDQKTGVRAAWESVERESTWQPPKKGVNPFPKKDKKIEENADSDVDDSTLKESVNPNRWKKLAGIIKECSMDQGSSLKEMNNGEPEYFEPEDDLDYYEPSDLDDNEHFSFDKPEWEDHFDNDRESGAEMSNMSIENLIDKGFSDEEIIEIIKDAKKQRGITEVVDSDEDISGNTSDNTYENENEDLTMMQESFNANRWKKLAGIKENTMVKKGKVLKEMDPFNGFADDPKFDEDGMPIEDEDEERMKAMEDEKFSKGDRRSDRPGRK